MIARTDGTRDLLEREFDDPIFKKAYHEVNQGKGAALETGFAEATGDIVVIQDADLEYDPAELPNLFAPDSTRPGGHRLWLTLYGWRRAPCRFLLAHAGQ